MLHYKHRDTHKEYVRMALATGAVVFVLLADFATGGALRSVVRTGGSALWYVSSSVGSAITGSGILATRHGLELQVRSLEDRVADSQDKAAGYDALAQENEQLRAMLNLPARVASSTEIVAQVVSSTAVSPYGTFIINAGDGKTVKKDMLVVTPAGFVFGVVSSVDARQSLAGELFTTGSKIDAIVGSTTIALSGRGGGSAYGKVAHGIVVREGDIVTSAVYGHRPIGVVGKVETDAANTFSGVYVSFPANPTLLRFVFVIPSTP